MQHHEQENQRGSDGEQQTLPSIPKHKIILIDTEDGYKQFVFEDEAGITTQEQQPLVNERRLH